MLDYDCQITTENFELTEQICYRLVSQILRKHLVKHIVFTESVIELKFFFIVRPQSKKLETGFKSGFHILIPGLQTTRSYKKYLINSLSKDATVHKLLKSIHVTNSEDALDFNSASVPTLFLGSCKPAGLTYILDLHSMLLSNLMTMNHHHLLVKLKQAYSNNITYHGNLV